MLNGIFCFSYDLTIGDGNVQEQLCRKAIFHQAKAKVRKILL